MPISDLPFPLLGKTVRILTETHDLTGQVISFSGGPLIQNAPQTPNYAISLLIGITEHHFTGLTADTEAWLVDTRPKF